MKIPQTGLTQLLKGGYKHLQGVDEAVIRNIDAIRDLSQIVRTSLGPNGRNKMVVNQLEKLFVTNDAATVIKELEVVHPAAKLVVMASQQQEAESGDCTNFIIVFAGELLSLAENLLRMGLHPSNIIQGYRRAASQAELLLEDLSISALDDPTNKDQIIRTIKTAIASKQYGYENLLSDLIADAILTIMPKNPKNFNVDSIRVVKVLGGSIHDSRVVKGMVFGREPESFLKKVTKGKVAIFSGPLDVAITETKGTVLLHNAQEMLDFSKGEEHKLEAIIKELADGGVKIIVGGSSIGELALHFLNRYNILVVKVLSKFDIQRLCRVTGATALARIGLPTPEEMGFCDIVETIEIGSDRVTVFRQEEETTKTATIVLRGGTQNALDDLERAVDDGVNVIKAAVKDNRLVAGAGATEIELSKKIQEFGEQTPGLDQYSIKKFGEALEVIPRTLAENAGLDSTEIISSLYAAHNNGSISIGVDIENEDDTGLLDAKERHIYDLLSTKSQAIRLASHVALTVLSVDQIIMSKPAGGPKVPKQSANWDED